VTRRRPSGKPGHRRAGHPAVKAVSNGPAVRRACLTSLNARALSYTMTASAHSTGHPYSAGIGRTHVRTSYVDDLRAAWHEDAPPGVVFVRHRDPEQRHEPVAQIAADISLEAPHFGFGLLEEGIKEGQHPFRAQTTSQHVGVRQLAEQHRRLLVLALGRREALRRRRRWALRRGGRSRARPGDRWLRCIPRAGPSRHPARVAKTISRTPEGPARRTCHLTRNAAIHAEAGFWRVISFATPAVPRRDGRHLSRAGTARPLPGSQQSNPVLRRQLKRLREAAQRMEMRKPPYPPFQISDAAHAEPGPISQLLLRQSHGRPVLAKQLSERPPPRIFQRASVACRDRPWPSEPGPAAALFL
jgi:hypothetical protein